MASGWRLEYWNDDAAPAGGALYRLVAAADVHGNVLPAMRARELDFIHSEHLSVWSSWFEGLSRHPHQARIGFWFNAQTRSEKGQSRSASTGFEFQQRFGAFRSKVRSGGLLRGLNRRSLHRRILTCRGFPHAIGDSIGNDPFSWAPHLVEQSGREPEPARPRAVRLTSGEVWTPVKRCQGSLSSFIPIELRSRPAEELINAHQP